MESVPGSKEVIDRAFSVTPGTSFTFLIGFLVVLVTVMIYAVVSLYKQNISLTNQLSSYIQDEKEKMMEAFINNSSAMLGIKGEIHNQTDVLKERFDRLSDTIKDLTSNLRSNRQLKS